MNAGWTVQRSNPGGDEILHAVQNETEALPAISFVVSVRPSAWNNSADIGQIFMKFDIWVFFENLSSKSDFH